MNGLKNFIIGVILTMVALFLIESVYNWKESKTAFMDGYQNGRDSDYNIEKK